MTIRASQYFIFNGIYSTNLKISNCNVSTGLLEEPFTYSRTVNTITIKGRENPYLQYIEPNPLKFTVTLFFEEGFNSDSLRELVRLLDQPYYSPMIFSEDLSKIYYCLLEDDNSLSHNCINQGYVTLSFICNSPFCYTQTYTQLYDLSINNTYTDIVFINNGDVNCKPKLYIQKINNGNFSIVNLSNIGIEFKFTGLLDQEEISINNEHEIIITSLLGTHRYNDFNDNYLSIPRGVNNLRITGTAKFKFEYEFKLKA